MNWALILPVGLFTLGACLFVGFFAWSHWDQVMKDESNLKPNNTK